jgi:hypothetical protein
MEPTFGGIAPHGLVVAWILWVQLVPRVDPTRAPVWAAAFRYLDETSCRAGIEEVLVQERTDPVYLITATCAPDTLDPRPKP